MYMPRTNHAHAVNLHQRESDVEGEEESTKEYLRLTSTQGRDSSSTHAAHTLCLRLSFGHGGLQPAGEGGIS